MVRGCACSDDDRSGRANLDLTDNQSSILRSLDRPRDFGPLQAGPPRVDISLGACHDEHAPFLSRTV